MKDNFFELFSSTFLLAMSLSDVDTIFSIISCLVIVSITVINFILKMIRAFKDGEITDAEMEELDKELDKAKEHLKNGHDKN